MNCKNWFTRPLRRRYEKCDMLPHSLERKHKKFAGSRIWTYAVKHQVISLEIQITRLNDSAIPATVEVPTVAVQCHAPHRPNIPLARAFCFRPRPPSFHPSCCPLFYTMDSLIPFTTSGALVDCVDSTSTPTVSYFPNDHLSLQDAFLLPLVSFSPSPWRLLFNHLDPISCQFLDDPSACYHDEWNSHVQWKLNARYLILAQSSLGKMLVILRDGRKLQGVLRSYDQFG